MAPWGGQGSSVVHVAECGGYANMHANTTLAPLGTDLRNPVAAQRSIQGAYRALGSETSGKGGYVGFSSYVQRL